MTVPHPIFIYALYIFEKKIEFNDRILIQYTFFSSNVQNTLYNIIKTRGPWATSLTWENSSNQ